MSEPRAEGSLTVEGFWGFADGHRDVVAVIEDDGSATTFGDLLDLANRLGNAVQTEVPPGSDVAILTSNSAMTLGLLLGLSQVGVNHTMVNRHLSVSEISYILRDSDPRLVFVDERTVDLAKAAIAVAGFPSTVLRCAQSGCGVVSLDEWLQGHSAEPPLNRTYGPPMLYTSGTSGRPKGVRLRAGENPDELVAARAATLLGRFGIDPAAHVGSGVHIVAAPLYHAAPMYNALIALDLGHQVVIMSRFEPQRFLELVDRYRVTWTQVVPTMMKRLVDLPSQLRERYDTSSLRWVLHAAAPCPTDVKYRTIEWLGPVVWEYYSSTEGGGTVIGSEDWLSHPGSVGRPWPGADIKIFRPGGELASPDEIGDIYFLENRPFVYHNDPEKTSESRRCGYATAGDLGWLDKDGYLYIADRRTDLVISGGVNVYPAQIEDALSAHPDVADVGVVGCPDADMGQVIHAVVQPRYPGSSPTILEASLREFAAARLSSTARPRTYEFRHELPRNAAGKLLRRVLREQFVE